MAAHIITGINQVLEDIKENRLDFNQIETATSLDCWTADDYKVWEYLFNWVKGKSSTQTLEAQLKLARSRLRHDWERYDHPETREEWWEARLKLEK